MLLWLRQELPTVDSNSYHSSLRDYLLKRTDHEYPIKLEVAERALGETTIRQLQEKLKFNICNLRTSYKPNSEIPPSEINNSIPPYLAYACRHWIHHVTCDPNPTMHVKVDTLIKEKGIFWLEALSLLSAINIATPQLRQLARWRMVNPRFSGFLFSLLILSLGYLARA